MRIGHMMRDTRGGARRWAKAAALMLASALASALLLSAAPASATTTAPALELRVDQIGFEPTEAKHAYLMSTASLSGVRFSVRAAAGATALRGSIGHDLGQWNANYPHVYDLDFSALTSAGDYTISVSANGSTATSAPFKVGSDSKLFGGVVTDLATFFQEQRDGSQVIPGTSDRKPSHLADSQARLYESSGLYDSDGDLLKVPVPVAGAAPVNVSGGWFDAGDYLKFASTTSYAVILMMIAQSELPKPNAALEGEIDHGLQFLNKLWDDKDGVLYMQVGLGDGNGDLNVDGDHDIWRLPEVDDTLAVSADATPGTPATVDYFVKYRPVFAANLAGQKISPNLAGRITAAFALAASRTAASDPAAAKTWLAKAKHVYDLADTSWKGPLKATVPDYYYAEDTWRDDMTLGATELAVAGAQLKSPDSDRWLAQATGFAAKNPGGDLLNLYDVTPLADAQLVSALRQRAQAAPAFAGKFATNQAHLLGVIAKKGLDPAADEAARDPFRAVGNYSDYDVVSHSFGVIATALLYKKLTGSTKYDALATDARNWNFGANAWGMSWVVGVGQSYPQCMQQQVANLVNGGKTPLTGAVVNGPNGYGESDPSDTGPWTNFFGNATKCPAGPGNQLVDRFAAFQSPKSMHNTRFFDWVSNWATDEPAIDFTASGILAMSLESAVPAGPVKSARSSTSGWASGWPWILAGSIALLVVVAVVLVLVVRRRRRRGKGDSGLPISGTTTL